MTNDWITGPPGAKKLPGPRSTTDQSRLLTQILRRLPHVARALEHRHDDRDTLRIQDEYDVQDLLDALLQIHFTDIRRESPNPRDLGRSSRVDFLPPEISTAIEVKKTRPGLRDKELGAQLAEDITFYKSPTANLGADTILFYVYDPEHLIRRHGEIIESVRSRSDDGHRLHCVISSAPG